MQKRVLYFLVLCFGFQCNYGQEKLTETQKLVSLAKVWGFLKYYHPQVAKGSFNWDGELVDKMRELEAVETKEALNKVYATWFEKLGAVPPCTSCSSVQTIDYFDKNFDLSWTDDASVFTPEVIQTLDFIEKNRNQGYSHYVKLDATQRIQIQNEQEYSSLYPEKEYRLLALFQYWNIIEYFFSYKYQTDQAWKDVLPEMITKFIHAKDKIEFHLVLLELITKIDDSHGYLKSGLCYGHFGTKKIPVKYQYCQGKLLVNGFLNESLAQNEDIRLGDVITHINGKSVDAIVASFSKYNPASNKAIKIRNAQRQNVFLRSNADRMTLTIEREQVRLEKKCRLYTKEEIKYVEEKVEKPKWELLPNHIGLVHLGMLLKEDVPQMFQELQNSKAIIFDARHYPNGTGHKINEYIASAPTVFWSKIGPDVNYPGRFIWKKDIKSGSYNPNAYQGEIVLLVNENSQSQAEFVAMILQAHPRVTTIGSQTAGADGDICRFKVAGFETCFSGLGVFYPDGTETQRKGVKITMECKPTLQGLKANRDEVLERALLFLATHH
ncbi:S41 family peptidase [Flavobacterium sp.]|uniref:S41 family peptidase n=1 Tax=Flavobacterium sp. TaxID=239 RepID=UPI003D0B5748